MNITTHDRVKINSNREFRGELKYLRVILTGWKEISEHLGYAVRTLQRWEGKGLPVKRVNNSPRSPVVANSEELDAWILRGNHLRLGAPHDLLKNRIQRAHEVGAKAQREMQILHERMEALRRKMAAVRAVAKQLRNHGNRRNTKARHQAAGS